MPMKLQPGQEISLSPRVHYPQILLLTLPFSKRQPMPSCVPVQVCFYLVLNLMCQVLCALVLLSSSVVVLTSLFRFKHTSRCLETPRLVNKALLCDLWIWTHFMSLLVIGVSSKCLNHRIYKEDVKTTYYSRIISKAQQKLVSSF